MDKLSRQVKELEIKLHNFMNDVLEQKKAQVVFNTGIANNVMVLGRKVFPDKFDKEGRPLPDGNTESKIITPGGCE